MNTDTILNANSMAKLVATLKEALARMERRCSLQDNMLNTPGFRPQWCICKFFKGETSKTQV